MGLIDSFLLIGVFLATLFLAAGLGALLRRLHLPRVAGCLPPLLLLAALFIMPLSLATFGVRTSARVVERKESLNLLRYTGATYHAYHLTVHVRPRDIAKADPTSRVTSTDSVRMNVSANVDRFDRTHVGDLVDVVYLPFRPSIGRLADRSLADFARMALGIPEIAAGALLLLAIAVAITLSGITITRPALRPLRTGAVVTCLAVVLGAGWVTYQNPRSVPEEAVDTPITARIVDVHRIDRTLFTMDDDNGSGRSSTELAQPFDVVEVAFTPPGGQEVHAADAVDAESMIGLKPGAKIAVRYATRAPRTMRLVDGERTFRARNARGMLGELAIGMAVLVGVAVVGSLLTRRKRTA